MVQAYAAYVRELTRLARSTETMDDPGSLPRLQAALNGQPGEELRRRVGLERLRRAGAFFSGSTLANLAVRPIAHTLGPESVILDPACGAGDLLIACARHLPIKNSGPRTLKSWAAQLTGRLVPVPPNCRADVVLRHQRLLELLRRMPAKPAAVSRSGSSHYEGTSSACRTASSSKSYFQWDPERSEGSPIATSARDLCADVNPPDPSPRSG